jgi:hypothetical protein
MFRYPGLAKIIDNPEGEVSEDPYDHKEADEAKCGGHQFSMEDPIFARPCPPSNMHCC